MIGLIFLSLVGILLVNNFYHLFRNYQSARRAGLPTFIVPWNMYNPLWMVPSVSLQPYLEQYLPSSWYQTVSLAIYGFEFRNAKVGIHDRFGEAVVLVTSGPIELSTSDPELAVEVLKRLKEFPNTKQTGVILNIFGPSVLTSDGDDWTRQRKLIAPIINEKISALVFGESISQARQMLDSDIGDSNGVTNATMQGMKTVAMNVLGLAAFGIPLPWKRSENEQPAYGHRLTYMEATKIVVENLVAAAVFPARMLLLPILPQAWQDIGHAKNEFPIHTRRMLEQERLVQARGKDTRSNLMSMLVRMEGKKGNPDGKATSRVQTLSEEEILGNLFVFTSAGFDTTANTMAYALAELATYPQWQDWLYEEIHAVVGAKPLDELEYNEIFPRLPRCLALMFETMRLFPPLTHVNKQAHAEGDVTVHTPSNRTYIIPRKSIVYINTVAIHRDPKIWGMDSHSFNPARWLVDPLSPPGTSTVTNVRSMPRGTFLAWSMGPRVCPGMKFSQVEFVSVFMAIFAEYRVEGVKLWDGETEKEMAERFENIMMDSAPILTLQMKRNQDLKVRWVRR